MFEVVVRDVMSVVVTLIVVTFDWSAVGNCVDESNENDRTCGCYDARLENFGPVLLHHTDQTKIEIHT